MIVSSSRNKSIQIETTTKISDLPVNLVEEILSRVPLKSTRSVRLTCKQWEALSKSRSFSKMHIDKLSAVKEGESTIIAMMDYNLYLMKVVLADNNNKDPFIECQGKLACVGKKIKISQVFHCDGLLLCVLKDDDTKVIVWNPYWGQTRSIQESRYSRRPDGWESWERFTYALGYEEIGSSSSSRRRGGYKFLRFIDRYSWYEVYDFESSSWKSLDIIPDWSILCGQGGASLKGNTYWPASQRNTEEDEIDDHIICFDFTSESFGPLLRLPFDAGRHDCVTLSCVRDEKLAVLLTPNEVCPTEFEIWISTKIKTGAEVLWSKFLKAVATEFVPLMTGDSFLVDEEKKVAMGFEEDFSKTFNIVGEAGYLEKLKLVERVGRDRNCRANVCSYVPSLVQISQPASGRKRKQQCRLRNATI